MMKVTPPAFGAFWFIPTATHPPLPTSPPTKCYEPDSLLCKTNLSFPISSITPKINPLPRK